MASQTRTLVESATRGDAGAAKELLARYASELRAFIQLRMGPVLGAKESSSDLAQSVCREVLADLGDFEYRGELAFKRWLFLNAHRKLASRGRYWNRQQRAAAREHAMPEEELMAGAASLLTPSRVAVAREQHETLWRAIEALTPDQRQVLVMARGLGMKPAEIAEELGKSANVVRVTLHRALARLAVLQDAMESE